MHWLGFLWVFVALAGIVAALVWNFVPSLRDRTLFGNITWSRVATAVEAAAAAIWGAIGWTLNAVHDAQAAGYLPAELIRFAPWFILAWFVVTQFGKRRDG